MNLYILDTDHLSIYKRGHPLLVARISALSSAESAVSIVSIEEVVRGRLAQIRAAKTEQDYIDAYRRFQDEVRQLNQFQILSYDDQASREFTSLRARKLRVGTHDLRIAAIALAVGGIVLIRNSPDFGQVPGLTIQDWTV